MVIKIDGLYTKLIRRAQNISWRDHVSNKELYGDIPRLSLTISQRRLRFSGHCFRAENQPVTKLLFWTPQQGKRARGPGIKTYLKMLREDTQLTSDEEIKGLMADRKLWRKKVNRVLVSSMDD